MKKQQQSNSKQYFERLGRRESSGKYGALNYAGYLGKYQMGEAAMVDAGYYKKNGNYNNDWSGQFTGKDGVYSKEDFLKNQQAQENAVRDYSKKVWGYIKNTASKYDGEIINGIPMTQSGMLAGAHLVGQGALLKYLNSNGKYIPKDGNGVSIEEYIKNMGNYPVTDITNTPPNPSKYDIYQKILNPFYKPNSHPIMETGFAAPFTPEQIGAMNPEEFARNETEIFNQVRQGLVKSQLPSFDGYTNPLTGHNQIFTREDIGSMSNEEFAQKEKEIMAQLNSIGIPENSELESASKNGSVIYVNSYTRSDGTKVKGYYRSK
ncbi:hypothetical protein IJ579_01050 [bacterium]|nr:hypothetical protein [bacterium]